MGTLNADAQAFRGTALWSRIVRDPILHRVPYEEQPDVSGKQSWDSSTSLLSASEAEGNSLGMLWTLTTGSASSLSTGTYSLAGALIRSEVSQGWADAELSDVS
jgi:hypothetical protein